MPLLGSTPVLDVNITDDQGKPVNPTVVDLSVTDPAGTETPYNAPANPSVGLFQQAVPVNLIGRWRYVWTTDTGGQIDSGTFLVVADDGSLSAVTDGPNSLWCSVSDVLNRAGAAASSISNEVALDCALVASNLLYVKSGRQFVGQARGVFRPCARPRGMGVGAWASYFMSMTGSGWIGTWGIAYDPDAVQSTYYPPEVDLGVYPLTKINEVKIDGVVIPADEYRVDDWRKLVRQRPTINAVPTERWGWPMWQDLTLPPTQPGTFSVDATWGMPPPPGGASAAAVFAAELAKARTNQSNNLPQRTLNIVRQGVSVAVRDPMEFLVGGFTGIYEVDLFLSTYNPAKAQRRARVWSPDLDRMRKTTSGG